VSLLPAARIASLITVEHAFASLYSWPRLSRPYEGTEATARACLEMASFGYLLRRS
jgi:hypothetical protein